MLYASCRAQEVQDGVAKQLSNLAALNRIK